MSTQTVVITGANRGIGLELVRRYRDRGDRVYSLCRSGSDALAATGAEVVDGVDVTSADALLSAADRVGTAVDVLIANAGILTDEPFETLADAGSADRLRRQFEVNAIAPLMTVHAFADLLNEGSKVAVITSRMGSIADNTSGGRYGYRMSKAALNAAARSLAVDLSPRGVAVAVLHPGFVRTDMTGGRGQVEAAEASEMLVARVDALTLESTGTFWHASGEVLPW